MTWLITFLLNKSSLIKNLKRNVFFCTLCSKDRTPTIQFVSLLQDELRKVSKVIISLFVQLMHTNYCKIVKQLKSFNIIIVAPTCFGLHKPSSRSSLPVLRYSYNVEFGYISLFEVTGIVGCICSQQYR